MRDIIIGAIGSIIGSVITIIIAKIFFGGKHFNGIFKIFRLLKDCHTAGIINIFPNRKFYSQHRDHGTAADYIKRCNHDLTYVGYWLASSLALGEIINTFRELINQHISVNVVFIDPTDENLLLSISKYLGVSTEKLKRNVQDALEELIKLKNELNPRIRKYLTIKLHRIPLSASAFIIQQSDPKMNRILIDYKLYNFCRDASYGIEYKDSSKEITKKIIKSYLDIFNEASEYSLQN